ncbi:MAG TPA: shikimate dehydrogenase [Allosphingosinicella sp.]|nr:shikimate dehydrogenase [Allosphingosinicella sp.]
MGIPYAEVIGDPIAHSKSPAIHRFWLERLGIEGDYRATRVTPDALPDYFESRRTDPDFRGCNVTMPLKEAAFRLLDCDPLTRRIGALNTVIRYEDSLIGSNTDWQSLNLALGPAGDDLDRVAIVGAGGAARAALADMRIARVPHVILINRSPEKARALLERFELTGEVLPLGAAPQADLLINASPLGMEGYPALDIGLSGLFAHAAVLDMVYQPLETPLIRAARARGLKAIDGLTMLIHQASMAFTHFFKVSPEPADSPALRELLTS